MVAHPARHKSLQKLFGAAMTPEAYANLRRLADESCLGNNYVLTVLLENNETVIDRAAFRRAVEAMLATHRRTD